jgi:hypothetical protein
MERETLSFRELVGAAAVLAVTSAALAPVLAKAQSGKAVSLDRLQKLEVAMALYESSYDERGLDMKVEQAPPRQVRSSSSGSSRKAAQRRDAEALAAGFDEAASVALASWEEPPSKVDSLIRDACDDCSLPMRFPYELPLTKADPDGCFEIAKEFLLDDAAFCALVFAEASMYSSSKDTVQNSLASMGLNPSGGLKEASHTTIGAAQMAPKTAANILEKLQELGPHYFERLGISEGEEDIENWLMIKLATDWRFALQLQGAYAYVNLHPFAETSQVAGSTFDRYVKEVYNPKNEDLHARWLCLYTAFGGELPVIDPGLEVTPSKPKVEEAIDARMGLR